MIITIMMVLFQIVIGIRGALEAISEAWTWFEIINL